MSRYIHNQQATNKAFENLDFSDVGTIKELIQTEYQKEQFSPKTSSFRGFLYIPMNPSGTTKTQKNMTVANR